MTCSSEIFQLVTKIRLYTIIIASGEVQLHIIIIIHTYRPREEKEGKTNAVHWLWKKVKTNIFCKHSDAGAFQTPNVWSVLRSFNYNNYI